MKKQKRELKSSWVLMAGGTLTLILTQGIQA